MVKWYIFEEISMPELSILKDNIEDIDSMPPRHVLDNLISGHGEALINFVNDIRLYILNGRLDPQNDNFTYISDKGKSVLGVKPWLT